MDARNLPGSSTDPLPPISQSGSDIVQIEGSGQKIEENTTALLPFRDKPLRIKCPYCDASVDTEVKFTSGVVCWIICLIMVFWGLWLGCCLIPFCFNGFKDCEHICPSCKQVVGKFIREEKHITPYDEDSV